MSEYFYHNFKELILVINDCESSTRAGARPTFCVLFDVVCGEDLDDSAEVNVKDGKLAPDGIARETADVISGKGFTT